MPRVVHTGQALVDVVVDVPGLPPRGGNVMATSYQRYAGGAVNVLVAAARSGAEAVHAGAHGAGPNGDLVRATLAREDVTVTGELVADLDTGICFVMVDGEAQRTFVTTQGAERRITVAGLGAAGARPGDLVCVSGYTLVGPSREPLLRWLTSFTADQRPCVVVDPGAPFAALPADVRTTVLGVTAVWTGNAEEAAHLSGVGDPDAAVGAVAGLLGPAAVAVVRDGPRGCWVHEQGRTTYVPGYPQEAVDTNGAGDAHTGVLLAGRARGLGWVEAARRANAAGAIKVTRRGPATAPRREEVDAFLAQVDDGGVAGSGPPPRS